MLSLVIAILAASLLGSLHCAGMCGAFLAISLADRSAPAWRLQTMYHLGRLMTYVLLGALAGLLGASLDLAGSMAGVQRSAAALSSATLVVFGSVTLLRVVGVRLPRMPVPGALLRYSEAGHRVAMGLPATSRALMIGLLTTLLPCGWLYAFVLVAAGSGSVVLGPVIMAVFWVGTVPLLVAVGAGIRAATGPLARHAPVVAAVMLICVGTASLVMRTNGLGRLPALAAQVLSDAPHAREAKELTEMTKSIGSKTEPGVGGPVCH